MDQADFRFSVVRLSQSSTAKILCVSHGTGVGHGFGQKYHKTGLVSFPTIHINGLIIHLRVGSAGQGNGFWVLPLKKNLPSVFS